MGDPSLDPQLLWPDGAPAQDSVPGGEIPRLTPYPAANPRTHGAIVVCPGGGYGGRAPHEAGVICEWLNSFGVSAVLCDYRVAPYRHPMPLRDAQRAIRWLRHTAPSWHVDPAKIGILGFSAGGHLTATAATHYDAGQPDSPDPVERESCRPDVAILCYAVCSFVFRPHQGSIENLLGPDATQAQRESLSAELQVTADTPPTFLWSTADDPVVPVENSLLMAGALTRAGVPYALHVYPHGPHGMGLALDDPEVSGWTRECAAWLTARGFAG